MAWPRIRDDARQQPVVVAPVPDVVDFPRGHSRTLLVLPQCVQLWEASRGKQDEVPPSRIGVGLSKPLPHHPHPEHFSVPVPLGKVIPWTLSTIHTLVSNNHPPRFLGPTVRKPAALSAMASPSIPVNPPSAMLNINLNFPILSSFFPSSSSSLSPFCWVSTGSFSSALVSSGGGQIHAHSSTPKTVPGGRARSTKHWGPRGKRETHLPTRKGLTAPKGFNQQDPLSVLSREGCSGPGCPSTTKSGPPGKMGRGGGDCENVAYVEGWQCCLRALIWGQLFQNIPTLRRTQAAS